MQFIIAPAKQMRTDTDSFDTLGWPQYIDEAATLLTQLRSLTYAQAKKLWVASDKVARPNYDWLQHVNLREHVTPAVMAYVGIQYQNMAPDLLDHAGLAYLQKHLRILSGFYGVLRPFDAIVPYRLEMGSRMQVGTDRNLYAFWGRKVYAALDWQCPVINLASQEYVRAVTPYLEGPDQLIDVVFGHLVDGHVKTRATYAKMARGSMIRFAAERNARTVAELTEFDDPHYAFAPDYSTDRRLVFLRRD